MALFVAALVIWFVARVSAVVLLVLLAVLVATYLAAITDQLEHRFRVPRWAGITISVVGTVAGLVGIGALILPPVIDQTQALITTLPQTLTDIQNVLAGWASQYPVLRRTELANPASGFVSQIINDATDFLRESIVPYLRAGGKGFVEGASVIVMGLYLARSPAQYRANILALVPPRSRPVAMRILDDGRATLRAWVGSQLLAMFVLGVLTAIGLLILGTPYWLAFGVLAGVAAVVPFFGTLVSTVLPALFVVGTGDWIKVTAVLLLGVVVHVVEANFVAPLIMEKKVSLPPVLTISSVLVMGTLFGAVGLVVAVPILALTIVLVRHIVQGEIYGDIAHHESAVLRGDRRTGADRRRAESALPPAPA